MLTFLVEACLRRRLAVGLVVIFLCVLGVRTMLNLAIEAFPDLTNNQVVVLTECPGMAAREVEQFVSFPIETALMGIPRSQTIRSVSKLGLSMVTIVLDDDVPLYFARQLVNERLQEARNRIPAGLHPQLGPVATAFGEVYQYTVDGEGLSARARKTIHDWQIRNALRTVRGVSEVNSWGGETAAVEIEVDPVRLRSYGLTLQDVFHRVAENNANFSAGYVEHASQRYTVLGTGRVEGIADFERIVLASRGGTGIRLGEVAVVREGSLERYGATTRAGQGETVSGMAIMLKDENARDVIARVKEKLAGMKLPEGVRINPFYDQSEVIDGTLHTVRKNLLEAGALVIVILLVFLGDPRAALVVALVIPVSMLAGFAGMAAFGISANLMSLGAIDFGMIVDGAVVMVENAVARLAGRTERSSENVLDVVRGAAVEVARPVTFAVGIIIAVYIPVLTLEGLEGRMFRPMAITVCSALIGSLLLALFVVPAASSWLLRRGVRGHAGGWFEPVQSAYARVLAVTLRARALVAVAALALVAVAVWSLTQIGTEFMPRLDEGSILITSKKLPEVSLRESVAMQQDIERILMTIPEVRDVVTKLGRPDLATEAMGIYEGDAYVLLKPREEWQAKSKEELIEKMAAALEKVPGVALNFTQPMAMRLDEVISGIKADLALKIYGPDTGTLERFGERALRILSAVPGSADTQMELTSGVPEVMIHPDRAALARYGFNVSDVQETVEAAVRGHVATEFVVEQRRVPVMVRLPGVYRENPNLLGDIAMEAPGGERVRLGQLAAVRIQPGPEVISREQGQRRMVVQSNVRGRDLGSFADEARARMARELALPAGYSIDWGGQFENQERAMQRLLVVVPMSITLIFVLLTTAFGSVRQAFMILLTVPMALVGGVAALWVRGLNLNLSASIGFIALSGVAVLNGIVMVAAINRLAAQGGALNDAIIAGARSRLRPVLMTALVASFGFLPMAIATTTGAEVQRPLATVVIGGLFSATPLTLFVLPAVYGYFRPKRFAP
jgi:cobalt-zinc-cadmium resistance protein CzcA